MIWKTLPTEPGKCEIKAMVEPMPPGPFALVFQHDTDKFEKNPLDSTITIKISPTFAMEWGFATYVVGGPPTFEPVKVAYYYCTGD